MRKTDLLLAVFSVALWCGCERLTPADFEQNKFRPSDFFDFNTSRNIELDLDYGPQGAYSFIELYEECPVTFDPVTREYVKTEDLPLFKHFTDTEGRISSVLPFTLASDSIFVYSEGMCVPRIMCLPIEDNKVVYRNPVPDYSVSQAQTRAATGPQVYQKNGLFYSIVDWSSDNGKPKDVNGIISTGIATSDVIKDLQKAVWNGKSSKPGDLDNRKWANRETRQINTTIAQYWRDDSGKLHEVTDAEVFLTFISESGSYQNTLGYYYYPEGKQPSSPANLKKFIILPNASIGGNSPWDEFSIFGITFYRSGNAPVTTNQKIQLLYVDDNGKVSKKFPPGITIGYFIISDGFQISSKHVGSIDYKKPIYYSDKEWNNMGHFISLTSGDYLVYGIEDTESNYSYEDILFTISATPTEAIADPEHASIEPTPEDDIEETYEVIQTYCYEDLWPVRGDYDMNDVVIEHSCKIGLDKNNRVVKITDVFTPVNRYMSAQVEDAFAVVIPKTQRGVMRIPATAVLEDETESVILCKEVQDNLNKEMVITRLFENDRPRQADIVMDLDPYIIPMIDDIGYLDKNRREVHMPKKNGTSKLNPALLGMGEEAYFIDKDGKHPFAITIPLSVKKGQYVLPTEMTTIDKEYPEFTTWAESDGAKNKDWFKHKK